MSKALLVTDMLNDFIKRGGALYCGEAAESIVPFITAKIQEFRQAGGAVIFICDSHDADDEEFNMFPKHCVAGTSGAAIIDELRVDDMITVEKKTYDGYYNTTLGKILEDRNVKEVYLVGVCTSICIMETASSLVKRGYAVTIYKEGVADLNDESHQKALKRMEMIYGAKVI